MNTDADRPAFSTKTVTTALAALRQTKSLGADHPLAHFASLRDTLADFPIEETVARDIRVLDGLSRLIERHLAACRRFHQLSDAIPTMDKQIVLTALRDDFRCGSAELEAWSLLYHRFICIALDLSVTEIAALVGETERTLHRRLRHGFLRLTQELIHSERKSRAMSLQRTLRAQLPSVVPPLLVGRESILALALKLLREASAPCHVLAYGATGVGKSTLALAAAHGLIDHTGVQAVAWVQRPSPSWNDLAQAIACQLGQSWSGIDKDLSLMLQSLDTLIVIDNAQPIVDRPRSYRQNQPGPECSPPHPVR